MSIETSDQPDRNRDSVPPSQHMKVVPSKPSAQSPDGSSSADDWEGLLQSLRDGRSPWNAKDWLGPSAKAGSVYRWGIAVSSGSSCDELVQVLSRLACGTKVPKPLAKRVDLTQSLRSWMGTICSAEPSDPLEGTIAVLWSASLPALVPLLKKVDQADWQALIETLLELHAAVLEKNDVASPSHLILGAEMGWTLATVLDGLACCPGLKKSSAEALNKWCKSDVESVSAAITGGVDARLVLASLIRCKRLMTAGGVRKLAKRAWKDVGLEMSHWVAAMTTPDGGSAFASVGKSAVADDRQPEGLLDHAARFDPESLKPAIAAALGQVPRGGRLAWEVSLPEAMLHDADAKLAVMMPEWDVRRGRMHVDYGSTQMRMELFLGRPRLFCGYLEPMIRVDGDSQQPEGDWEEVCEYSDDDVHYLEIEQAWTGGCLLQRQLMLLREDRCVFFADAVLPSDQTGEKAELGEIEYTCRFPIADGIELQPEKETREVELVAGRKRSLVVPLAANEWRVGPTRGGLAETEDGQLAMNVQGQHRLYAPLWIDLQQRRLKRKRTWRQLTVTDQLRIARQDEAVGYRIQLGPEQWMVYRSLRDQRCRSVLGKHLIADFFCARFDAGDGSYEELITVDDNESNDE